MYRILSTCLLMLGLTITAGAQGKKASVTAYERDGAKFYYSNTERPKDIIGHYTYEGKGDPIVDVNADGTGQFQPHMVQPIPMHWWIETNEKGEVTKTTGENGVYQIILVVRWGAGGGGNYPEGTFTGMQVTIRPDMKKVFIMGEREKALN